MDVKRGSIGGGWRLFVEFDSYAIAHTFRRLSSASAGRTWEVGVTRWGLFSRRGVHSFIKVCRLRPSRFSGHSSMEWLRMDERLSSQIDQVCEVDVHVMIYQS